MRAGRWPVTALWLAAAATFAQPLPAQDAQGTTELGHVGPVFFALQVRDLDAMAAWYGEVFALQEVNRLRAEDGRYSIRILAGGGMSVELIHEPRAVGAPDRRFGVFKVGLHLSDLSRLRTRLSAAGVEADAPFVDRALGMRTFVFRDPEGNRIQAFQPCAGAC